MVIHSFAVYLLTSTFVFIFSRRLWHGLEILWSQNLPGSEIRGRRNKTKNRSLIFNSASEDMPREVKSITFCLLSVPVALTGSGSSGRPLGHWSCGVYGFSKFVSPTFTAHWVDLVGKFRFTSQQGSSFIFCPLQISDHVSKLLICAINTNMCTLTSYKEVHVSVWCCDLDRMYTLQETCVWKKDSVFMWWLCWGGSGNFRNCVCKGHCGGGGGYGMGCGKIRDIFLMVLSSLSLFPVCCVFHITDCQNQDTLHKHMRPSRHGPNEPSGPWAEINLPFLKPFVLVTGSVLSNAVVSEDNDSHVSMPISRHKYIYFI